MLNLSYPSKFVKADRLIIISMRESNTISGIFLKTDVINWVIDFAAERSTGNFTH